MKFKTALTTLLALGTLSFASTATAAFITGNVDFTGNSVVTGTASDFTVTFSDYTAIDSFLPVGSKSTDIAGSQSLVSNVSGDLSSLVGFATMNNFSSTALPVAVLWFTDNFSFSLTSVSVNLFEFTSLGAVDNVTLSGKGILSSSIAGLEDTNYTWDYSSQGGLTFSANSTPVSAPSAIAILGMGLIGLSLANRRKKKVL